MEQHTRSPRIARVSWGRLEVEGYPIFKDAKLFPGGARAWDWRDTGTQHEPGTQPADVEELLEHGATVVVLSRGMTGRLRNSGLLTGIEQPSLMGRTMSHPDPRRNKALAEFVPPPRVCLRSRRDRVRRQLTRTRHRS